MRALFQKFTQGLWGAPEPKVIWLKGEPLRRGLDTREASHKIQEVMQTLVPEPFRLELGEEYWPLAHEDLAAPIRLAWSERGYRMPALVLEKGHHLAPDQACLHIYGLEEPPISLAPDARGLTAREIIQLELSRAVVASLKRVVNRDFVRELAEEQGLNLPLQQLGRLSKYFRCRWQAGLSLPPVAEWPGLSESAPFDDIGMLEEPLQYRPSLSPERRKSILLRAASQSSFLAHMPAGEGPPTALEQLQALEEFSPLRVEAPSMALRILRSTLLANRLTDFQIRCRCQPEQMLEHILHPPAQPCPTLPVFQQIGLTLQSLGAQEESVRNWLESYLGKLAPVQFPTS